MTSVIRTVVVTVAWCGLFAIAGGFMFLFSGVYNIAADVPHAGFVRWALETGRTRSVNLHSRGITARNVRDPVLIKQGTVLYGKNCRPCHGAPGVASEQLGLGITPKPPPLMTAAADWSDSQLFWIVSHGLKLSGMPGFAVRLSETERWAIIAFVRRMTLLSPADYQRFNAAADAGVDDASLNWLVKDDQGFTSLKDHGNAVLGRELLRKYGCPVCHAIPKLGSGSTGPPLDNFAERQYIAGILVNVPVNAVSWITNPKRHKLGTAMPQLGVQPEEALHMVAWLYSGGSPKRLDALRHTLGLRSAR